MIRRLVVLVAVMACKDKPPPEPEMPPIAPVARDAAPAPAFVPDRPGVSTFTPPNHASIRVLAGAGDRVVAVSEDAVFVFDQHLALTSTFALPAKIYSVEATVTAGGRIVVFASDRMWTFELAGKMIVNVAAPTPASVVALASEQVATVGFDPEVFEIRDVASGAVLLTRHAAPNTLAVANDGTWAVATRMNEKSNAEIEIISAGAAPALAPLGDPAITEVSRALPVGDNVLVIGRTKAKRLVAHLVPRTGLASRPLIAIPLDGSSVGAVATDRGLVAAFFAYESEDSDRRGGIVIDTGAAKIVSRHQDGPYSDRDHVVGLRDRVVTTDGCRALIVMDPFDASRDHRLELESRCISQLVGAGTFVIGVGDHGNLLAFDLSSLLPHA